MLDGIVPQATLSTIASFPPGFLLENLAIRADHSILVTVVNRKELWHVPPAGDRHPAEPILLSTFDQHATSIVETAPDVFIISASNLYTTHESFLYRLDLRRWKHGTVVRPTSILQFPEAARALNCCCMISSSVLLVADGFGSRIWRVDLDDGGGTPRACVWLEHESMGYHPGALKPEQPGVNGVQYDSETNTVFFTSTAKKLLMRVPTDPITLRPTGAPELVAAGRMGDDFFIDDRARVIYLTTHRQNTIDRIFMDPEHAAGSTQSVAGSPFKEEMIGPTSGVWGRGPDDYGKVAYITTDGGIASPPPDGVVRPAKVLRVEFWSQ